MPGIFRIPIPRNPVPYPIMQLVLQNRIAQATHWQTYWLRPSFTSEHKGRLTIPC
jgi:hypothetical protein